MKTLKILNKRIEGIMKMFKSLKNSSLLTKDDAKSIENEAKEQGWISWYIIRYIRCQFIRIYVIRKQLGTNR